MYPMAHLLIAAAYARSRPALATDGAYYLGAIAPDAIHMRKESTQSISKFDSHLKARGEHGLSEVIAYWYEAGRTPFDIGYGVHAMSDRCGSTSTGIRIPR